MWREGGRRGGGRLEIVQPHCGSRITQHVVTMNALMQSCNILKRVHG